MQSSFQEILVTEDIIEILKDIQLREEQEEQSKTGATITVLEKMVPSNYARLAGLANKNMELTFEQILETYSCDVCGTRASLQNLIYSNRDEVGTDLCTYCVAERDELTGISLSKLYSKVNSQFDKKKYLIFLDKIAINRTTVKATIPLFEVWFRDAENKWSRQELCDNSKLVQILNKSLANKDEVEAFKNWSQKILVSNLVSLYTNHALDF